MEVEMAEAEEEAGAATAVRRIGLPFKPFPPAVLAIEIVLLLGLAVAWFGEMWGIDARPGPFTLPAAQYEIQSDHRSAVAVLTIWCTALLMIGVIGLCYIRKPFMMATQIVLFAAVAVTMSKDASWAWHILHPIQPPPSPGGPATLPETHQAT